MWKIIGCDNLNRETVADWLVCDNISDEKLGEIMLSSLRNESARSYDDWYVLVPQDHRLSRGMEDIV